jgi:hypothetical protein
MPIEQVLARIRRALLLDTGAYVEARDDTAFTPYAAGAAVVAALLGGIGAFLWATFLLDDAGDFFLEATILGTIFLIILWVLGVVAAYLVLSQVYREQIAPEALGRVLALGYLPFAVSLLVFVPGLGFTFGVLSIAAMFFYSNYGIRAAWPEIEPLRVMVAVLASFAVWLIVVSLFTGSNDQFAPGPFVFEWSEDVVEDLSEAIAAFNDLDSSGLE